MNGEALAHSLSPLNLLLNCSLILLSTFWANFDSCLPTPALMSHLSLSLFLLCEPLAPVVCARCNAVSPSAATRWGDNAPSRWDSIRYNHPSAKCFTHSSRWKLPAQCLISDSGERSKIICWLC